MEGDGRIRMQDRGRTNLREGPGHAVTAACVDVIHTDEPGPFSADIQELLANGWRRHRGV